METIIYISGILVFLSVIPYAIRVWQKKITPNIVSWGVWAIMGFAIFLGYEATGGTANRLATIFGCINPLLVVIILLAKNRNKIEFSKIDIVCAIIGIASIILWYYTRQDPSKAQSALYLAIVADLCGLAPTINWVKKNPKEDRPLMWMLYSFGYGIGIFAITEHTVANYILPLYMLFGSSIVAYYLLRYRLETKSPFKEWYGNIILEV